METEKIGIIVVNYNTTITLFFRLVKTLYDFTNPALFNLLIIDNGSKDWDIPKSFSPDNAKIVRFEKNLGLTKAWNYGVDALKPADIVILGSDITIINKQWLKELIKAAEENPQFGMIHAHCLKPDKSENLSYRRYYPLYSEITSEIERMRHDCVYIRRKLFDDVGIYNDEFFVFGSDVDLQKRAKAKNWKFGYCGSSKVSHFHGLTSSRAPESVKIADDDIFMKIYNTRKKNDL